MITAKDRAAVEAVLPEYPGDEYVEFALKRAKGYSLDKLDHMLESEARSGIVERLSISKVPRH